ncbi:MAG: helix-turn-helix transcriptional regulator [Candidatus Marinimicrobia bacterium]|jgi:transcriptional regulator with XRE-family HTH domain|nr:helix-turn-helix transcriptional regulator [Candidatus Neomarinimicrobiota bacterium]MBT4033576.1 helix-turn-helix transcriptional regulator [Candidatus Neomarinimicrobiota bacterium]MBT4359927.1 helix-turn-helix transcriptional regulator [Candidatus Neomarinimicrobiota bacterium]MBT4715666.1 helix-turn-helix transcriptional regulator [Candidatus Neomarinimicrobiota bacterium]MBT4945452.1 helix-turn-helix transcriptional regulator [Candidatus Neomarinimicrobiota bacterium]
MMVYSKQAPQKLIGATLKRVLQEKALKPADLARETGINVRTIYSILNGHQMAGPENLATICGILGISLDDLFQVGMNSHPIFSKPYEESRSYAHFENIWFGENGGERISVSRGFSVMNQSLEMRDDILRNIYGLGDDEIEIALQAFQERQLIIEEKEKRRLEIVVESEIIDLLNRRSPFDRIDSRHIDDLIQGLIHRLEEDVVSFEMVVIPREKFVVNYQIINREVILFDLGTTFLRQQNPVMLEHFIKEVNDFKKHHNLFPDVSQQIDFLNGKTLR